MELPHAEFTEVSLEPVPVFCSTYDSSSWYEDYSCKGFVFSAGGGFPDDIMFDVSIVEGEEYGTLFFEDMSGYKIEDDDLSYLSQEEYRNLYFKADGEAPEDTGKVKIIISASDETIPEAEVNINVVPNNYYPIRITFEPEEIEPGDTASIILEKRYDQYPFDTAEVFYEPFEEGQLFNVFIEEGNSYGTILDPAYADTSDEFYDIEEGFKFIANETIDLDTAKISIKISTMDKDLIILAGSIQGGNSEDESANKSAISSVEAKTAVESEKRDKLDLDEDNNPTPQLGIVLPPEGEGEEIFGIGKLNITKKEIEILLGETKFLGLRKKGEVGEEEYEIAEISCEYGDAPQFPTNDGWTWIENENVWSDDPVIIGEDENKKSGIYWEKKYPIFSGSRFIGMSNVEPGIIRIIGRYWEEGKEDDYSCYFNS